MHRNDIDDELGQPGARDLLERGTLLRLAYDGTDGHPRVIPVGFFWTGRQVVICTATSAPKVRALQQRPDVALTIDIGSTPFEARSLLIRGRAEVQITSDIPAEYIAAARKSLTDEQAAAFEVEVAKMYDGMARIAVTPTWARYYDFGGGRLPEFLQRLADEAAETGDGSTS